MPKPATIPSWATNANFQAGAYPWSAQLNKVAPAAAVIAEGFTPQAGIPVEWLNYLIGWLCQWATWLDAYESTAHSWTALQTMGVGGAINFTGTGDATYDESYSGAVGASTRKLIWQFTLDGTTFVRAYRTTSTWELTYNADWYDTGAGVYNFRRDSATESFLVELGAAGLRVKHYPSGSATPWLPGAWLIRSTLSNTQIAATSGNLVCDGAPAGNVGPGLAKAVRYYATGSAVSITEIVPGAGWGTGATVTCITNSCDTAADFYITANAAGVPAVNPTIVVTYKDGTFTNTPVVVPCFYYTDDGVITLINSALQMTSSSATGFTLTLLTATIPVATKKFYFAFHVIGV